MRRIAFFALIGLVLPAFHAAADSPTPTPTEEKEGTISGTAIARPNGTWLGIEIKDQNFWMTFYNAKKKPVAADAAAAVLWWPVKYQPNAERTELTPTSNPAVLASSYVVKPPLSFLLHITLLTDANAGAAPSSGEPPPTPESYVINFGG
jgi:hypothetical protein